MGPFLCSLCCITVITLLVPKTCVALETIDGTVSSPTDDDVYQQLLRRVDNLEKRDQHQQTEIDTLRGELNTEKQRTTVLEMKLERLQNTLIEQRESIETKPKFEKGDTQKESLRSSEPESVQEERFGNPLEYSCVIGEQTSRIRRHLNMPVVAFHATLSSDAVHVGVNQGIAFDRVVTNMGAAYNPHAGSFVAPFAGVYVFFTTVEVEYHNKTHASVVKNGISVAILYIRGIDSPWNSASAMVVLHLNRGDDVMVRNNEAGDKSIDGGHYSMFSGFMLSQDGAGQTPLSVVG